MMHACKHVPQKQHQVFPKITTSSLVAVIILHALLLIKLSVSYFKILTAQIIVKRALTISFVYQKTTLPGVTKNKNSANACSFTQIEEMSYFDVIQG
mmetsp:Transcript_1094/g.1691  ORF Transcript_1094/g.1691 Transcript_1094/m.1691 type:complete len:97 (-) Transcript_1094:1761-2051(-)